MIIQSFIDSVKNKYGKDLSVYSASFLKKAIARRWKETASSSLEGYTGFLIGNQDEMDLLTDSLLINYTVFFRNRIDVALLEEIVFPELIRIRKNNKSFSFRIWTVGCSDGPEAFSFAMIANDVINESGGQIPVIVFGTDISGAAIAKAKKSTYSSQSVENVRLSYLNRYFEIRNSEYIVNDKIRSQVDFTEGDIIDINYTSPPSAIFADFDLVSCCNLMIYYNHEIQQLIMEKLYHSLGKGGYLLVDASERLIVEKYGKFRLLLPVGNIYIRN